MFRALERWIRKSRRRQYVDAWAIVGRDGQIESVKYGPEYDAWKSEAAWSGGAALYCKYNPTTRDVIWKPRDIDHLERR